MLGNHTHLYKSPKPAISQGVRYAKQHKHRNLQTSKRTGGDTIRAKTNITFTTTNAVTYKQATHNREYNTRKNKHHFYDNKHRTYKQANTQQKIQYATTNITLLQQQTQNLHAIGPNLKEEHQ